MSNLVDKAFAKLQKLNSNATTLEKNTLSNVTEWIDTGCLVLNSILSGSLYGGVPKGRITIFAGASGFTGGTYLPSVGVSVLGLQFAETVEVSNISITGFRITIKDKNNNTASVARNFSYTASGFGKGV